MSAKLTCAPLRTNTLAQLSASLAHAPLRSKATAEPGMAIDAPTSSAESAAFRKVYLIGFSSMAAPAGVGQSAAPSLKMLDLDQGVLRDSSPNLERTE